MTFGNFMIATSLAVALVLATAPPCAAVVVTTLPPLQNDAALSGSSAFQLGLPEPHNNVTLTFERLFAAVMARSKPMLEQVFADDATGYTVGPQWYPFPNKTALVDMLFSCSYLDPVYGFYDYGIASYDNTGIFVADAPYVSADNAHSGIPTDFLYIELDKSRTRISKYLEFVPLQPIANHTKSIAAFDRFKDAFLKGSLAEFESMVADGFTLEIGQQGQNDWTRLNRSAYLEAVREQMSTRLSYSWKKVASTVAVNIVFVQYTWIRTDKRGVQHGTTGRNTLMVHLVGDGDYRIQRIKGYAKTERAYSPKHSDLSQRSLL